MEYELDGSLIHSLPELHRALASLLSFPAYYAQNFDALHDCLTDSSVTLRITHWDALEDAIGIPRCISFKRVLQDSAEESEFSFVIQ